MRARVCVFVRVCVLDSWWLDGVVDKMGPGGVGGGFWISVSATTLDVRAVLLTCAQHATADFLSLASRHCWCVVI